MLANVRRNDIREVRLSLRLRRLRNIMVEFLSKKFQGLQGVIPFGEKRRTIGIAIFFGKRGSEF